MEDVGVEAGDNEDSLRRGVGLAVEPANDPLDVSSQAVVRQRMRLVVGEDRFYLLCEDLPRVACVRLAALRPPVEADRQVRRVGRRRGCRPSFPRSRPCTTSASMAADTPRA